MSACANCGTDGHWADTLEGVDGRLICWPCRQEIAKSNGASPDTEAEPPQDVRIVTAQAFAAVDEPGAEAIVGEDGQALIPEGGDVMIYGDGGASKTTLAVDLAVHLAAGDDWLGAKVAKPVRVALIEAEGPRPLFRRKVRAKLEVWGERIGDRLHVVEAPWAEFQFPEGDPVADVLGELEVDVLIVGPLTRVGWEELGTLQHVRDFMITVDDLRKRSGRRLTVTLVHHENKGGAVSGAFEGAGDTLLHAEVRARGKTTLMVQKARWSSEWHKRKLELGWTNGEDFKVLAEAGERDLVAEMAELLKKRPWLTAKEISRKAEAGGIGANVDTVKGVLAINPKRFTSRTGEAAKAVDRHPSATVWNTLKKVTQAPESPESPCSPGGGDGQGDSGDSPYRESPSPESPPPRAPRHDSTAEPPEAHSADVTQPKSTLTDVRQVFADADGGGL